MTTALSPTAPTVTAPDVESALAAMRAAGLRVSAARRLVVEALFAADGPVAASAIADGLAGRVPRSDITSVYRNLETLEAAGLVRHVHLGHGPGVYMLAGLARGGYVLCERCATVRVLDSEALAGVRAAVRAATGFEARFSHFPIAGLCPECAHSHAHAEEGHAHP